MSLWDVPQRNHACSPAHYGIRTFRNWRSPEDDKDPACLAHQDQRKAGGKILGGVFSSLLALGEDIGDGESRSSGFYVEFYPGEVQQVETFVFESKQEIPGQFCDERDMKFLCKIKSDYSSVALPAPLHTADGGTYYKLTINVKLFLGRTELRATTLVDGKEFEETRIVI